MQSEHWRFAKEHQDELIAKLGERDVVSAGQTYEGAGVAGIFSIPEDVVLLRLGRRDFEDHERCKFQHRQYGDFLGIAAVDYAVFLPVTKENIQSLIAGKNFRFYSVNHIKESTDGWVQGIDPAEIHVYTESLNRLANQMPKRRVPKVTRTDVKVGNSVVPGILSSNADDEGDIEIHSVKNSSGSVLYNPNTEKLFRPAIYWGGAWQEPVKVSIKRDQLFFDDRGNGRSDSNLWMIQFKPEGYEAVPVA